MRHAALISSIPTLILVGCATDEWPEPDDPDPEGEAISAVIDDHNGGCPDGGGGGGEPSPILAPRDCTTEPTWEQCYDCCDWNSKNVWEETCRRLKKKKDRDTCWKRVENQLRPQCYKDCNRPGGPITTVAP